MGIGEGLLIALVFTMAIIGMLRTGRNSRGTVYKPPTQSDQDMARIRQMKEWDRFDNTKNGKS